MDRPQNLLAAGWCRPSLRPVYAAARQASLLLPAQQRIHRRYYGPRQQRLAVETASVQYDAQVQSPPQLIASTLFADGAAAFIVGREGAWRFEAAGMSLVPDSRDLLRMSPDTEC